MYVFEGSMLYRPDHRAGINCLLTVSSNHIRTNFLLCFFDDDVLANFL